MNAVQILLNPATVTGARRRRGLPLLATFVILVAYFLWMDASDLPDYEAYEWIYHHSVLGGEWEVAFVLANVFFRQLGLSYSDFRHFTLVFSSLALWCALSRPPPSYRVKSSILRAANSFLIAFILAVFIFEYFVIRIRAGFAIGIICWAVYFSMSPNRVLGWILAGVFLMLAFFTHNATSATLIVFLGLPFLASRWLGNNRIKRKLFVLAAVGSVAFLLYITNSAFELRGPDLFSPLNPVRFAMLSIVPLALFVFTRAESKTPKGGILGEFPFYFVRLYVIMAAGLALMFLAGLTVESGEALVRLYTLSSVPAMFALRLAGSATRAPISAYVLSINALFFLVTVFVPAGAR